MKYGSCYDFKIRKVVNSWSAKAGRSAVLVPITGLRTKAMTFGRLAKATNQLIRKRRRRIYSLADAGCSDPMFKRFPDGSRYDKDLAYFLNCPPSNVVARDGVRACRRQHFCPFCWDREIVQPTYRRLESFYFGSCQFSRTLLSDCDLLEIVAYYDDAIDNLPLHDHFDGGTSEYVQTIVPDVDCSDPGMIALRSVSPSMHVPYMICRIDRFLIPIDRTMPTYPWLDTDHLVLVRRHFEIKRSVIAGAVSRAARYPLGMMLGSMDVTADIMEHRAMSSARWYRTYGRLRNKKVYKQALTDRAQDRLLARHGTDKRTD